jgi:phage gpG-like protein
MSEDVKLDTKGLDALIKALKDALPRARVGVLGSKSIRAKSTAGPNNATVGAFHEFGQGHMPQRSFLRVPIAEHLQSKMEGSGAFDKDVLAEVVKQGTVVPWVKKIATLAVSIVHEAFDTQGFGKWPGWKNPTYTNDHGRVLEDTGQLRDSITSDVK